MREVKMKWHQHIYPGQSQASEPGQGHIISRDP